MPTPQPKRALARSFRKAPTSTERLLWRLLRDRRLGGIKFRRQAPVGPNVADFVCFERRLIIRRTARITIPSATPPATRG